MPEHTLLSYYYAFFEGADFIDVDIQPTKDGQFIVFHDALVNDKELYGLDENTHIFTKDNSIKKDW